MRTTWRAGAASIVISVATSAFAQIPVVGGAVDLAVVFAASRCSHEFKSASSEELDACVFDIRNQAETQLKKTTDHSQTTYREALESAVLHRPVTVADTRQYDLRKSSAAVSGQLIVSTGGTCYQTLYGPWRASGVRNGFWYDGYVETSRRSYPCRVDGNPIN